MLNLEVRRAAYVLWGPRARVLKGDGTTRSLWGTHHESPDARRPPQRPRAPGPIGSVVTEYGRPLWDAASGRFNPVTLRAAIVCRGWTVRDFAAAAGISRACLYNVLRRQAASDRTVVRVAATLASREPLHLLTAE
jgi:lambda repressor-like predicted transcriptional regulator